MKRRLFRIVVIAAGPAAPRTGGRRRSTSPASGRWSGRWTTPRTRGSATGWACRSMPTASRGPKAGTRRCCRLPEYQCRPHGWAYIYRGPTPLRISKEVDPFSREVVAYQPEWHQSTNMPVYLDGREHPPAEANHTWGGFSHGQWEGDMLKHQHDAPEGGLHPPQRRDGQRQAKVTTCWIRRGDILTWVNIVRDPIYLAEPLIRSSEYRLNVNSQVPAHPCTVGLRRAGQGQRAALPAGREPVPEGHPRPLRPGGRTAHGRPGDDVSRST